MRTRLVAAVLVLSASACSDAPTNASGSVPAVRDSSKGLFVLLLPSYGSYEEAAASLGGYTDAIASAGYPNWGGGSVSTLGYFQYKYANRVVGNARMTTFLGASQTRQSSWQTVSMSRLFGGDGTWEAIQKPASVSLTNACGLSAQAEGKMDASYVTLVQTAVTTIFDIPDSDESWGDQGACSPTDDHPDIYDPTGTEGGGGCAPDDEYDHYVWNYDEGYYDWVGTVCLSTLLIPLSGASLDVPPSAASSASAATPAVSITLALTAGLPAGAHARVLRRPNQRPQQIVLVDPAATSNDLVLALATVGALRARDGDAPTVDVQQTPRGSLNPGARLKIESSKAVALLKHLQKAPSTSLPGIGTVRSLDVSLGSTPRKGKP